MAMAVEEAQIRFRNNAFQAKYFEPNWELNNVNEDLNHLSTKLDWNIQFFQAITTVIPTS